MADPVTREFVNADETVGEVDATEMREQTASPPPRPKFLLSTGRRVPGETTDEMAITLDPNRPKWEKQDAESIRAYDAFKTYLNMPKRDRSIQRAANYFYAPYEIEEAARWQHPASQGEARTFQKWSSIYRWIKRCRAYDEEMERRETESRDQQREAMKKRHIDISTQLQQKVLDRLRTMQTNDLSVSDMKGLLDIAVKMERLALGEPTDTFKQQGDSENPLEYRDAARDEIARRIDSIVERRRAAGVPEDA